MSTIPMPAPPCGLGYEQPGDAELGEPGPHVVGRAALVVEHVAHVRDRRSLGEEAAHRRAQQLLVLAELEVHRAPDCNEYRSRVVRLRYGEAEEAFRPTRRLARRARAGAGAACASRKQSSADLPEWARQWQRTLFDARLAGPRLAAGARRPQRDPGRADDLLRGAVEARHPPQPQPPGARHHRPVDQGLRDARAAGALPAPDAAGGDRVVPRHERARRRQRPREPVDARRARRRRLRRERPEGVDLGRAPRRLVPVLRAHRPRRAEAQGHQRADHRHEDAGHRVPPVPRALRARLLRLQRGVLHRRGGPAEHLLGELHQGWPHHAGVARPRTGDALDRLRVRRGPRRPGDDRPRRPRGPGRRRAARRPTLPGPGRGLRHRRAGAAAASGTGDSRSSCRAGRRPSTRC